MLAWTYPERTVLWQPYSKTHQLHPLQVKQKQQQHCNKLSRSPKREKHAAALLKIVSPSWKQRHLSSKQQSWRQLTTSSSCSTLALETEEFSYSSHKEQVPTRKLDQCMLWPLDVSKKDACSAVLDMVWLLQGTSQIPSFINEENDMYCQRLLHEVSMKTKPTPENKWNLLD